MVEVSSLFDRSTYRIVYNIICNLKAMIYHCTRKTDLSEVGIILFKKKMGTNDNFIVISLHLSNINVIKGNFSLF